MVSHQRLTKVLQNGQSLGYGETIVVKWTVVIYLTHECCRVDSNQHLTKVWSVIGVWIM